MRNRQSDLVETAHNIQAFLDLHAATVGPNITPARRNLDDAVTQLTTMAVTQTGSAIASKGATARQRALRLTLRMNYMKPVTTVAQMALSDVPEAAALTVKTTNLATPQLVAAAHAMADAAEKHADVFLQNGLPTGFATNIRAAADAVTTAVNGRQQALVTTSSAVSGLQEQESRVRGLIKLLNALVVPKLGTDATLLNEWKNARAIGNSMPIVGVPASVTAQVDAASAAATAAASTPAPSPAPAAVTPAAPTSPAA